MGLMYEAENKGLVEKGLTRAERRLERLLLLRVIAELLAFPLMITSGWYFHRSYMRSSMTVTKRFESIKKHFWEKLETELSDLLQFEYLLDNNNFFVPPKNLSKAQLSPAGIAVVSLTSRFAYESFR